MRQSFKLLILFVAVVAMISACSKKKKNSEEGAAPPPSAAPLPAPPPPVDPHSPQDTGGNYAYCGASYDNFVGPEHVQAYYDPNYNLDWYQIDQYATYWFAGQWHWYAPDCYGFDDWAYYTWSYYYVIAPEPTPCYTCICYTCGSYPEPEPPVYHPEPTPDPSPSCGGYSEYMPTKTNSTSKTLHSGGSAYVKTRSVPERQSYYIVFKAKYTGVGPHNAQKTDETARLKIDGHTVANIRDLNTSSSNSGLQNIYSESCYVKTCLDEGDHEFRFEGTGTSLVMTGFEIRSSRPSYQSCE